MLLSGGWDIGGAFYVLTAQSCFSAIGVVIAILEERVVGFASRS
jgi:hypothetical protein